MLLFWRVFVAAGLGTSLFQENKGADLDSIIIDTQLVKAL
jgi:hypothetical protein